MLGKKNTKGIEKMMILLKMITVNYKIANLQQQQQQKDIELA